MKYMILINHTDQALESWTSMSEAERAQGYQAHADLHEDLIRSGEMVAAEILADPSQARRVSVEDGRPRTVDGLEPGTGHLAGFYLVDCENFERAVEYAARIPEARLGLVEVRPVR